jgi:hypothetical protein
VPQVAAWWCLPNKPLVMRRRRTAIGYPIYHSASAMLLWLGWGKSMRLAGLVALAAVCAGCASSSSDIQPQYVSELQYQHLSCQQLSAEAQRISRRVAEVSGTQDEKASNDAVATGVALVIFWPAAFFIKGDGATAAELGRLKGEFEALERASIKKRCGHQFRRTQSAGAADTSKMAKKKEEPFKTY